MTAHDFKQHRLGLTLVALAALCWSTSGLFVRVIGAELMTMLFWRGVFSGLTVFTVFFLLEGRKGLSILKGLRWPALVVACLSASGMVSGISALRYGAVADAMVIYATVPFMTAGMAYLFIGERPSGSTLLASVLALTGVAIMLWGSSWDGSMTGKVLAVVMSLSMAGLTVVMRCHRDVPMLPAMGASAWLTSAFAFFCASGLRVSPSDLGFIAAFGILQNASGLVLYTFGSRKIPAAEATLVAALEVPFTPLWVLLVFQEVPGRSTLVGGALVLTALFGHILSEFRKSAPEDPQPFQVAP
jgi:drug/metabolite transporter (DMT)-like permease